MGLEINIYIYVYICKLKDYIGAALGIQSLIPHQAQGSLER